MTKSVAIAHIVLIVVAVVADAQPVQVTIDFDDLPAGTVLRDQFPNTLFSCEPGYEARVIPAASHCSIPNAVAPGIINGSYNIDAPLYVDFVVPIEDMTLCVDRVIVNSGGIIRVFENGSLSEEVPYACSVVGCLIDLTRFHKVTRIEMVPITLGAIWDDFSFTYVDTSSIPTLDPMGVGVFVVLLASVGAAFLWWRRS